MAGPPLISEAPRTLPKPLPDLGVLNEGRDLNGPSAWDPDILKWLEDSPSPASKRLS